MVSVADKVWKDNTNVVAIFRGHMPHYQIMAVTPEMKGDNAYLHNEDGLDFGVRVSYHTNKENTGVEIIDEPTTEKDQ